MPSKQSQSVAQVASVPQEVTGLPRRVVVGRVTWGDTFAALKHRNFRLFFIGQLVSLIGSWMQNTAQGWLVYQLTGSNVLLGCSSFRLRLNFTNSSNSSSMFRLPLL
jgi:hypothetical protein